jgi:hypothetical protein
LSWIYAHLVSLSNLNRLVDKLADSKRGGSEPAASINPAPRPANPAASTTTSPVPSKPQA